MISENCTLCPRMCGAERINGIKGFCRVAGTKIRAARAALHFWEEPCISGKNGSGAVFFSGCPLHCVYCQNRAISDGSSGREISVGRLAEIFFELEEQGAENINLVTPTHYSEDIALAIRMAKEQGLSLPFVYNCGGYERAETLRSLEGLIDIYLTDFKYMSEETAERYSKAADYPEAARAAVREMVRQCGEIQFDDRGMMKQGVIARILLLPSHRLEAQEIIHFLYSTYGEHIYLSLMNQYTPGAGLTEAGFPELSRTVTTREYEKLVTYALELGVKQAFIQEGETCSESFIPEFDNRGIDKTLNECYTCR